MIPGCLATFPVEAIVQARSRLEGDGKPHDAIRTPCMFGRPGLLASFCRDRHRRYTR